MAQYNATSDIATLPSLFGKSRNTFTYHKPIETTFNVGDICPFYCNMLVEPGDTFSIDMSSIIRTTTLKYPSNQSLIAEIFWFKQDKLNLYNHDKELHGENTTGSWTQTIEYAYPVVKITNENGIDTHHILAHLGFPPVVTGYEGTKMGLDMYHDVCNEWLRQEALTPPVLFDKGDSDITYDPTSSLLGGPMRKAPKFPDYFSSGIPEPQKASSAVKLPLGQSAPVYGWGGQPMRIQYKDSDTTKTGRLGLYNYSHNGDIRNFLGVSTSTSGNTQFNDGTNTPDAVNIIHKGAGIDSQVYADLTEAIATTFNNLRMAATTQQIYEADAYYGTRIREIIKSRYNVNTSADTVHIPEFLGGTRFALDQWQVPSSSESISSGTTVEGKGLAELGAYSQTGNVHHAFTKSFDYWGVIMGIVVVRYNHIYAQGLPAQYSKRRRFDFRQPEMEHLGFTPTYNREICMTGNSTYDNGVWNYRPIYQEYRYEAGESTGEFNPNYNLSLDYMSYVDDYDWQNDGGPVFSNEWIEENPTWVDRTLMYSHDNVDQIRMVADIKVTKVSELAQYGLPGLTRF